MDIVAKTILNFVQTIEGCENTVIAGGAARDYWYKIEPSDFDLFIPSFGKAFEQKVLVEINNKFVTSDKSPKDYPDNKIIVKNFTFENKNFDIIFNRDIPNTVDFGNEVIENFNFGINMIYFDGISYNSNDKYEEDLRLGYATLYNCKNDTGLVKSMEKYLKLKSKTGLVFRNKTLVYEKENNNNGN